MPAGTEPAPDASCGDQATEPLRVRLSELRLDRGSRREISAWLVHHCGRPDRLRGFWWTEESGTVVCFALPQHFMEFSLAWR